LLTLARRIAHTQTRPYVRRKADTRIYPYVCVLVRAWTLATSAWSPSRGRSIRPFQGIEWSPIHSLDPAPTTVCSSPFPHQPPLWAIAPTEFGPPVAASLAARAAMDDVRPRGVAHPSMGKLGPGRAECLQNASARSACPKGVPGACGCAGPARTPGRACTHGQPSGSVTLQARKETQRSHPNPWWRAVPASVFGSFPS
jgi:hypothetical protein